MNLELQEALLFEIKLIDLIYFGSILLIGAILHQFFTKIFVKIVFSVFKKYTNEVPFDSLYQLLAKPISWFLWIITLYLAFNHLSFPNEWNLAPDSEFGVRFILKKISHLSIGITLTWAILRTVDFLGIILLNKAKHSVSKTDDQLVPFIKEAIKVIVGLVCLFVIIGTVFNVNVASLIAGLGIGGLALALAAKESLENLMGSFTIFLDKPFMVGDVVHVEGITGTVEKIGFRSTQVRTTEKSILTVPNKKMVDQVLDNLSQRTHRRVRFLLGLELQTDCNQLKAITNDLSNFICNHDSIDARESYVKIYEFGESAINVLFEYYITGNDYANYLNVREEVNVKILEIVQKHGSRLAFPTRNILLTEKKIN